MNLEKLTQPLTPHEIEWRVQSVKNGKTTVVPYITNRAVIKRFNDVFGPMNWKSETTPLTGAFIGTLSVWCDEKKQWVSKQDISDNSHIEPLKGGVSGAYKRAAVHWGLGVELYEYPMVQIEGEFKFIPHWAENRLNDIVNGKIDGTFSLDYILIQKATEKPKPTEKPKHKTYEVRELTGTALKQWKGGGLVKHNGVDCILINGRKWKLSNPEWVAKIKQDPRYKEA